MLKFNKAILCSLICIFTTTSVVEAKEPEVYSWRSENGSVVFSEKKPPSDVDYKTIQVRQPTVVDTKAPKKSKDDKSIKIGQSDVNKLSDSELAEKNKNELDNKENSELIVQITSPANDANIFTKDPEIPVKTNPKIPKNANPTFLIDKSSIPGEYDEEKGQWVIARPKPGPHELSIAGKTAEGNDIKSSNKVSFFPRNGWVQQAKNTGNYRGN